MHPECTVNQGLDAVFLKAHLAYLDEIKYQCMPSSDENNLHKKDVMIKKIIYLDRNNDSGCWADISKAIKSAFGKQQAKTYKSVLILPESHPDFNPKLYNNVNHICPQMIYECIKRIFGRKQHECLSNSNRPKVVEIALRFTKLYDGVDLTDAKALRTHFDDFIYLDLL